MKRVVLAILLVTGAAAASMFLALNLPGAEASPDFTITVDSADDTNARDDVLTLREAMMLATGELALDSLTVFECNQVSDTYWLSFPGRCEPIGKYRPGAASTDTIVFGGGDFPPGGSATIDLNYGLPALDTGNDTVDGSATLVAVDGGWPSITPFDCFEIISDNNSIKGLGIHGCFSGIRIFSGAENNTIGGSGPGEDNLISLNYGDGVEVDGGSTTGNTIRGNSIHSNGGKGIENSDGGNTELAPPIVQTVGSVYGIACADCTVDVYSDDEDEGEVYEGSTTADGDGNWSFSGTPGGPNITATATDSDGNTSEFSAPLEPPWPAPTPEPTPVTPTPTGTPPPTATPSPGGTRTLVWGPGWYNVTWTGPSGTAPEDAFACAAGNYAATYRLVGYGESAGHWERHVPDRPDLSDMTDLAQYDALFILITADVTCEMPVADPPGTERTLNWDAAWQNEGWTGPDGTAPEDAFACVDGSYAVAYRLVDGDWEGYSPDRPGISTMGPLNQYDTFAILITEPPVNCVMPIAP